MAGQTGNITIWQWNCASFLRRKAALLQLIKAQASMPHVLLLQETLSEKVVLSGYRSISQKGANGRGIATLVRKDTSFEQHEVKICDSDKRSGLEAQLIEIIPNGKIRSNIFVFNLYSPPSAYKHNIRSLLHRVATAARSHPLIVAGDFNAPHPSWGYVTRTKKGANLVAASIDLNLTLISDPRFPTRLGNSVARDTMPDLSFTRNAVVEWSNLQENLGSDHSIIELRMEIRAPPPRTYKYTDWDLFRQIRGEDESVHDTFSELLVQIQKDVEKATKEIVTEFDAPGMDARLAHLLDAKRSLIARWKKQRLNRRLRKKIAELNRHIEEHCSELHKQQWRDACSAADGKMRKGGKWTLFKHLLDDGQSKGNQKLAIDRLINKEKMAGISEASQFQILANKYLPLSQSSTSVPHRYEGVPSPELDAPFSEAEIREVLHSLNGRSAPGPDGVTNRLLRNLDDKAIQALVKEINRVWEEGVVPETWKRATVVLIPKPGKSPSLDHLRPISLTSCLSKVAEHAVHNRISRYIERNDLFPYNMVGFRPSLSTQDVMLLLKTQIIDFPSKDVKGVLALDLTKAFDTVKHDYILKEISALNLGVKFFSFVESFLESRTAAIKLGQSVSEPFKLGRRGTPQGAVISPLLFNIAMRKLSASLSKVPNVGHALYADDITIWCPGGSEAAVEQALQEALDVTESFLEGTGLALSPEKSELLLYRQARRGVRGLTPLDQVPISVCTKDGRTIPRVNSMKILGLLLDSKGCNAKTIAHLTTKTENILRLIMRVSNKKGGIGEDILLRAHHAFLMSHIIYIVAALNWTKTERDKLDTLMRKSVKKVLGVPITTSTEKLMKLGVHNTTSELIEAQRSAQIIRLSSFKTGRKLLDAAGLRPIFNQGETTQLDYQTRNSFIVDPLPRNIHPQHNKGRRLARARAFIKNLSGTETFVDAARHAGGSKFSVAVVNDRGELVSAASVKTSLVDVAEQAAVALALLDTKRTTVYTDSRAAVRAFASGLIATEAARILHSKPPSDVIHHIVWFPAHMGPDVLPGHLNPNEIAHDCARGFTSRDGVVSRVGSGELVHSDPLVTFHEITSHYRGERQTFPFPHHKLHRSQASTLRMLQTGSYPSRGFLSMLHPDIDPLCPDCGEFCSLSHMLWQCPALQDFKTEEDWTTAITDPRQDVQLQAVQRARERAERHGLSVPTWD